MRAEVHGRARVLAALLAALFRAHMEIVARLSNAQRRLRDVPGPTQRAAADTWPAFEPRGRQSSHSNAHCRNRPDPIVCCAGSARLLLCSRRRAPDDPNGDLPIVRIRRRWRRAGRAQPPRRTRPTPAAGTAPLRLMQSRPHRGRIAWKPAAAD
jgi:hypothetical protein